MAKWLAYISKDEMIFGLIAKIEIAGQHGYYDVYYDIHLVPGTSIFRLSKPEIKVVKIEGEMVHYNMMDKNIFEDKHKALSYLFTELFKWVK